MAAGAAMGSFEEVEAAAGLGAATGSFDEVVEAAFVDEVVAAAGLSTGGVEEAAVVDEVGAAVVEEVGAGAVEEVGASASGGEGAPSR